MASLSGVTWEIVRGTSPASIAAFVQGPRMAAWVFHDLLKVVALMLPEATRKYVDLSRAASLADGVEDFCDGPKEWVEHIVEWFGLSTKVSVESGAQRRQALYALSKRSLLVVTSGAKTLGLLHKVGAISLGKHADSLSLIGNTAALIKTTAEVVEYGHQFTVIHKMSGESDETYNRRVGISFFEVVKKVSLVGIKALVVSGIVFGIATSPTLILGLSVTMLTSFLAINLLNNGEADVARAVGSEA